MEYDKPTIGGKGLGESYRFWDGKEEEMGYLLFQSTHCLWEEVETFIRVFDIWKRKPGRKAGK